MTNANVEAAALPKRVSLGSQHARLKAGRRGVRIHSNVTDRKVDEGLKADKDETVNLEEWRKLKSQEWRQNRMMLVGEGEGLVYITSMWWSVIARHEEPVDT